MDLPKDMYSFSQRKRNIHLCLLYAVRVAARGSGWMKAHVHDEDCNHLQACKECKFNVAHEDDRSIWKFCGIGILMSRGLTFTEAYQVSRDLRKPAPGAGE